MIPALTDLAAKLGVNAALVVLAFAGLLTGIVLLAQSVARWFEDQNP